MITYKVESRDYISSFFIDLFETFDSKITHRKQKTTEISFDDDVTKFESKEKST